MSALSSVLFHPSTKIHAFDIYCISDLFDLDQAAIEPIMSETVRARPM
jgi:hypothetical protein